MQRVLFFFILLLFSNTIQAQDLEFEENCVLFQDAKSGFPVLILQDSILYKGNPLKRIQYNHTYYPDILAGYVSYSIKGKTYLVHSGTGPVVEYRNDSIIACNQTPMFQNQYGATAFVFKNALHFFGGYGLFTYKNIVTKYDATNKDWVQVQTFGVEAPSPRSGFYSYLVNNNLYVFGGEEENTEDILNHKKCDNTVWRLHLPTMQWYKIGKFDSTFLGENKFLTFTANGKLYLIVRGFYGLVFEVDIVKNTIKKYNPKTLINPVQIYFDNTKKELVCVSSLENGKYKFFKANLNTFLENPNEEREFIIPFYKEPFSASFVFGIGILIFIIGILVYIKKQKKNKLLPFHGILFKKETGSCYYKNKLIDNFEEPELRVLLYLIAKEKQFIPLNELNHLFENGNNAENFSSIVKRREIALTSLLQKLNIITNISEKEILLNRKNPDDKRIKEIRIAPSFLKIK